MAIVINGSSNTISGVAVGGLPDGIVDTDMLASDAVHSVKIADDAVNGNKVSNDLTIANDLSVTNDLKINSGYGSIQKAYGVRVWCKINSSHTIMGSGGITSVTDNGTGDQIFNFSITLPDTHYSVTGGTSLGSGVAATQLVYFGTTSFRSVTRYYSLSAYDSTVTMMVVR